MTNKITFLRHYKLQAPYDNWRNMSLSEYINFTEGKCDPKVNNDIQNYLKRSFNRANFNNFQMIITSSKTRTIQTALSIKDCFNLEVPIVSSNLFDEIPSIILDKPTISEWELMVQHGRLSLNKKRVLDREGKIQRLKYIDGLIQNLVLENVLVISHSYLIGQLNYFYRVINKKSENFDEKQADRYEIGNYLMGFQT